MSINIDQVVVSDKFKHSDEGYKYLLGYQEDEIVKPLFIILPEMSGYIKCFEKVGKNLTFLQEIMNCSINTMKLGGWLKKIKVKFHSKPVYGEKYLKTKVRKLDGAKKKNILDNELRKAHMYCTCIASIIIDSLIKMEKKNYPQADIV